MDLPPQPPAVVYKIPSKAIAQQEKTAPQPSRLEQIISPLITRALDETNLAVRRIRQQDEPSFSPEYLTEIIKKRAKLVDRIFPIQIVKYESGDTCALQRKLHGQQVLYLLSHQSHMDTFVFLLNAYRHSLPLPQMIASESVLAAPVIRDALMRGGAIPLPVGKMNSKDAWDWYRSIARSIQRGSSIGIFPEGRRRRGQSIEKFESGGISVLTRAAKRYKKNLIVQAGIIEYTDPIERKWLPTIDKIKNNFPGVYPVVDTALFMASSLIRLIKPSGNVDIIFAEPFAMEEYGYNAGNIASRTQRSMQTLHAEYHKHCQSTRDLIM